MELFRPKQRYQGAAYPGIELHDFIKWVVIILVAAFCGWKVYTYDPVEESRQKEQRKAEAIIADLREEQFRSCLRDASGAVGVATTAQMNKCKEKFLNKE